AKLKSGEDFQELAKSLSTGPTAANGGNLGYFTKQEMVPEFANAAFSMDKNSILDNPVKTQFGWHVIQLLDIRNRAKPTFEQMEPMIRAEQRREILADLLENWRKDAKIEQFDINGKPLKEGADATGLVPAKQPADQQGG
ncbi:MAG TPA: peptidylprolyl isomerase, partial [Alphaproteobacteria bacterium]|nr:peptidylprolyl isomerase [Alphaproteobacteria bacterium]